MNAHDKSMSDARSSEDTEKATCKYLQKMVCFCVYDVAKLKTVTRKLLSPILACLTWAQSSCRGGVLAVQLYLVLS